MSIVVVETARRGIIGGILACGLNGVLSESRSVGHAGRSTQLRVGQDLPPALDSTIRRAKMWKHDRSMALPSGGCLPDAEAADPPGATQSRATACRSPLWLPNARVASGTAQRYSIESIIDSSHRMRPPGGTRPSTRRSWPCKTPRPQARPCGWRHRICAHRQIDISSSDATVRARAQGRRGMAMCLRRPAKASNGTRSARWTLGTSTEASGEAGGRGLDGGSAVGAAVCCHPNQAFGCSHRHRVSHVHAALRLSSSCQARRRQNWRQARKSGRVL